LEHLTPSVLKDLLQKATGESQHVVAVNIDIRGFSAFCERVESADLVVFIKQVYEKLVDGYFPNARFVKPTGDGLLIVIPYRKETVKEITGNTLEACTRVHNEFPSFCTGEEMISFRVPQKIGIGLSRGAASRIVANGLTVDYSGRVLNLASRLMNLARPSGIVFDAGFVQMLPTEIRSTFSRSKVWLWGIAEHDPIDIYYSKAYGTKIPAMFRKRLDVRKWHTQKKTIIFSLLESEEKKDHLWLTPLEREPADPSEITVVVKIPKSGAMWIVSNESYVYEQVAGEPRIRFDLSPLTKELRKLGFAGADRCKFSISYPR